MKINHLFCGKKIDSIGKIQKDGTFAGEFQQNDRPTTASFPPSNFAEDTFQRDQSAFSEK